MWDYIERLRNEPESKRRRFVLIASILITGILLLAWLLFILSGVGYKAEFEEQGESTSSPIAIFKDSFTAIGDMIGDFPSKMGKIEYKLQSTTTESEVIEP